MWKKRGLTPVDGGQDQETNGQVFQVKYGRISRLVLKILDDRVKRQLLLYDPRSDKPDNFVRIVLPDGALPLADEDCLPQHVEGVVIQWAREDADAWIEAMPMQHAHPECDFDDLGQGQVVNIAQTQTGVQVPQTRPAPPSTPASPVAAPAQQQPIVPDDPFSGQPEQEEQPQCANQPLTEKPISKETGRVSFMNRRDHGYGDKSYKCYTIDLVTQDGSLTTFRGSHLEDVARANAVRVGETITIMQLPRKPGSKKNRFHIVKH